jgi:hypothetical protein
MINPDARDKDTLALIRYIADEDKLEKILENQQVIKTPIVRNGKLSTIGYQPDVWQKWERNKSLLEGMMQMNYKVIDREKYYRKGVFRHFSEDCKCSTSMTARIDVTELVEYSRSTGTKFYINFLYLISKVLNSRDDYRMDIFGRLMN